MSVEVKLASTILEIVLILTPDISSEPIKKEANIILCQ